MDGGMRQIQITGACKGVGGAWGVAGTCVPFAWQEGVTAIVISWRRFFAIVALLMLYGITVCLEGVALSVALLELQAQFLTKPLVRRPWCAGHGAQAMVRRPWCAGHGAQAMVRRPWCRAAMVRRPWCRAAMVPPRACVGGGTPKADEKGPF